MEGKIIFHKQPETPRLGRLLVCSSTDEGSILPNNTRKMDKLIEGLAAVDREVVINKAARRVEIREGSKGESEVVETFHVFGPPTPDFREKNMTALRDIHAKTAGGRGRVADSTSLSGWKALGLADNSTHVDLMGRAS